MRKNATNLHISYITFRFYIALYLYMILSHASVGYLASISREAGILQKMKYLSAARPNNYKRVAMLFLGEHIDC